MNNLALRVLCNTALVIIPTAAFAQSVYEPYTFTALAGYGSRYVDGPANVARLYGSRGVAVDSTGTIYVADTGNHVVRRITASGAVSTLAGSAGTSGSTDGAGEAARFNEPHGVAIDGNGSVYVADTGNHTIRKISPSGLVSTLAGNACRAFRVDGTGTAAGFQRPTGLAVDASGNVLVVEPFAVRKITPSGVVSSIASSLLSSGMLQGTVHTPTGIAIDSGGNAYVVDNFKATIFKITPSGAIDTFASGDFRSPTGVAVDRSGNVYVAEFRTISRVSPDGSVSRIAGVVGESGSSDGIGTAARFDEPYSLGVDSAGNIYAADSRNDAIRKITPSHEVSTFVGLPLRFGSADGIATAARFGSGTEVAVDGSGSVYVADWRNHTIRKITPSGDVTTFAGVAGSAGSSDGVGSAARFNSPSGIAVDNMGNVYVGDTDNNTIRKITPSRLVTTIAGQAGVNSSGSADGIRSAARFQKPRGVTVDSTGNVFVADTSNHTIRKITPAGNVSTFAGTALSMGTADGTGSAARFQSPFDVAVDAAGAVYVADFSNHAIRKISPSGEVITFAGRAGTRGSADGMASAARLDTPSSVTVDAAGNVYVAETLNHTIRRITPNGMVNTVAGLPGNRGGVNGTGSAARFDAPYGIAVDAAGKLYVADVGNGTIRLGVPAPVIITSPLQVLTTIDQQFVYQLQATNATSLAADNLPPGLTFDSSLSAIVGTPTSAGTSEIELRGSNAYGTTAAALVFTAQPVPAAGPFIISSTSAMGRPGRGFRFQVIVAGGTSAARFAATGLPRGLTINAATGLISGIPLSEGSSAVTLTVTEGALTTSATLQLTFTADSAVPVIISATEVTPVVGQPFSYTIVAQSCLPDRPIPILYTLIGDLPPGLSFDPVTGTVSGIPTVQAERRGKPLSGGVVTNNVQIFAGSLRGTSTRELLFLPPSTGVVNISTRLAVESPENVLIGGFIVTGNSPKKMTIRAIGPSLSAGRAALVGALQDPTLQLVQGDTAIAFNDDWRSVKQEEEEVNNTLPPADNREAAIVAVLNPGSYTAVVQGKNGARGVALVELYDHGTVGLLRSATAKLANISTRGLVRTDDDVMIGGFIVQEASSRVIVRAIGPSLVNHGVTGALEDSTLELITANGSLIAANDDWRIGGQEQQIIDSTVPPTDDREASIVATLNAGAYTAVVRGKNNRTGVALVEVYVLQ